MYILTLIKYVLLGLIQGLTEPLPISSSGHLIIFQNIFGMKEMSLNFEIIVNAGSLVAIVFIFRKDIERIVKNFFLYLFKKEEKYEYDFKYALLLVVAVIPAGLAGLLLKDFIDSNLTNLLSVGISLLITGFALILVGKAAVKNTNQKVTLKNAIIIGLFQVASLVPGISRSGSTMVGGLTQKVRFEDTMKFSFLLYIPISLAAMLLGILDLSKGAEFDILGYALGFIASVFATYFAVKWFFKMVRKGNLKYFSYYCFSVGGILLIYIFITGVILWEL